MISVLNLSYKTNGLSNCYNKSVSQTFWIESFKKKFMGYLSPEIEVLAKRKKQEEKSLIKKEYSCGIFQDYGKLENGASKEKH